MVLTMRATMLVHPFHANDQSTAWAVTAHIATAGALEACLRRNVVPSLAGTASIMLRPRFVRTQVAARLLDALAPVGLALRRSCRLGGAAAINCIDRRRVRSERRASVACV